MENIIYDGIGEVCATCQVSDYVFDGCVVSLDEEGCILCSAEGEQFVGVAKAPRNRYTTVQFKGFATVGYTGTLSLGWNTLVADANGGVKTASAGVKALVVKINDDGTAVICL